MHWASALCTLSEWQVVQLCSGESRLATTSVCTAASRSSSKVWWQVRQKAIGAAYAQLGETMTEEHAAAVVEYLRNKPRGKHGLHRYEPEDWGFDRDVVRDELAAYIEWAGVELE